MVYNLLDAQNDADNRIKGGSVCGCAWACTMVSGARVRMRMWTQARKRWPDKYVGKLRVDREGMVWRQRSESCVPAAPDNQPSASH